MPIRDPKTPKLLFYLFKWSGFKTWNRNFIHSSRMLLASLPGLILTLTGTHTYGQDLITDKNGTVYEGSILSINPQQVLFTNSKTSQKDSLLTENLTEIKTSDKRRMVIFSESENSKKEEISETDFMRELQAKNAHRLLSSRTTLASVNFYSGRHILTLDAQKKLTELANLLIATGASQMSIEVYADSGQSTFSPMELSEKRAQSIKDFLTDQGIRSTRIAAIGRGLGQATTGVSTRETGSGGVKLTIDGIEGVEVLLSKQYVAPAAAPVSTPAVTTAPSFTAESSSQTDMTSTQAVESRGKRSKTPRLEKQKNSTFTADDRPLTIQLTLGALTTYPLGKSLDRTRTFYGEENRLSDSVNTFRNSIWPSVFVSGGFEVRYLVRPGWWVAGGLRYARQGFTIRKYYEYSDPLYQYDEVFRSRTIYQINSLEIPVYVQRQLGERLSVGLGTTITAAVSKRQQKIVFSKKVIINGKNSKEDAVGNQEKVNDISEYTRGMTPTALLNLNYQYTQHWGIQFRGQYSLNQYKEKAQVYNASAFLGLTYLF